MKKKNGKTKKGATIDDLARMMAKGFDALSEQIGKKADGKEMNTRFVEVNAKFAEVNASINRIELRLVGAHDRRLDKLENDFQTIKTILEQKLEVTFRNR